MNQKSISSTLRRVLALLLLSALVLGLFAGCASEEKPETTAAPAGETTAESGTAAPTAAPSGEDGPKVTDVAVYTVTELSADDPRLDTVVAASGKRELTNRDLQLFYYMQFFGFMSQYGAYASYVGLDPEKPLAEQQSMEEGLTWEQYFLSSALDQFHQFSAAYTAAEEAGHTLSEEEQKNLDDLINGLPDEAARYGYDSVDDYISASFGPGVTRENYENFMRVYFLAVSYENQIYDSITWTDEELRAFAEANPDQFSNLDNAVNNVMVRHILIQPENATVDSNQIEPTNGTEATTETRSEEELRAAAKARAEEILAEYKKDPTEDHFAELAMANSTDGGSRDAGGLYDDVYPGQMVQEFNDWCFDEARKPGDTDIVETTYGYHVMYFVGTTDHSQWQIVAQDGFRSKTMSDAIGAMLEANPLTVDYSAILIAPMPEAEEAAEEAEAAEAAESTEAME